MNCHFCKHELNHVFLDLGLQPPSNSFLTLDELQEPEEFHPLKVMLCDKCWLVQLPEFKKAKEIFNQHYAYFSSYSDSWLAHSEAYVNQMIQSQQLTTTSRVIEIASNDGYLLQYFKTNDIPCFGIEPTQNTAQVAMDKGIETLVEFFTASLADDLSKKNKTADLIIANNVLAHVPDINDFVSGLKKLLKPNGLITIEVPHIVNLVTQYQFDTIYHEHYSYFSLLSLKKIFNRHDLALYNVDELTTHGGSLRIYATHSENSRPFTESYQRVIDKELTLGVNSLAFYKNFQVQVDAIKNSVLDFLREQDRSCKCVVAYGAAAKGNTLLNYVGVNSDLIRFVVDRSPHKQGKYLPGTHIPIVNEDELKKLKPDYVMILPWNLATEIKQQLNYLTDQGTKLFVCIPKLEII